ncbi:hypothetical protein ABUW04_12450 [Streptacidiphilus sp. N1-10]|uniref:Uncharacterized protein n=1 Tax=Streptacidiphilus jeojiensis TaxID=3229225 RepID=A0ABV6XLE0_9ACTN
MDITQREGAVMDLDQLSPVIALPVDDVTFGRLHALACFFCGTTTGPLVPAGHVYTGDGDGGRYGWPVVACPRHVADDPLRADRP